MAIAALPDIDRTDQDEPELPWPKPALRLVPTGTWAAEADAVVSDEEADGDAPTGPWATGPWATCAPLHHGAEVSQRRRARASRRVVRRRVAAGLLVAGLLVLLALPIGALGGSPLSSHPARSTVATAGDTVYVVQPGDTLWSIASRVDPGDPRALVRELAARTGSALVHPGERIDVP